MLRTSMRDRLALRRRLACAALASVCAACSAEVGTPSGGVDTAPPVVVGSTPTGSLPPGTTGATLTVVTDEPATCRYDPADVAYAAMARALDGTGTTHTAALAGLADGVTYTFYVRCIDALGNSAPSSHLAIFRVASGVPVILWRDDIQGTSALLGFDGFGVEHPIGDEVAPADANGANLSRVVNPLPGGGHAMRHFGTFDAGGARAQAGIYGDVNAVFGDQARRPEGVWVAQEWYFPVAIGADDDPWCWLSVWDWHSIDAGTRGNRWHTSPGLLVARDGSMRLELVWGGPAYDINGDGVASTLSMPVGRWFDVEMHYEWVDAPTGSIQVWIDGQLALEQRNVQTRRSTHQVVETYMKFYGSTQGDHGPWVPTPTLKYTRNVRVAGERIWR
jgi:hypothetical protein